MHYGILGPLAVTEDGQDVAITAPLQRSLLAILLIYANTVVSRDRLIDLLWHDDPPQQPDNSLNYHISRLRKALGTAADLETIPPGYSLRVRREQVDALLFEDLAERGMNDLRGDPAGASETIRRALSLFRGDPLLDFVYEPFATEEIERLTILRAEAVAARIDADLAVGRHVELLPELEELVEANPLDESLHWKLATALYRSARQADALRVLSRLRKRLAEELGIEPHPHTREIEEQILMQDLDLVAYRDPDPRADLPNFLTSFVGRASEISRLRELIHTNRLVTLIGLGGIGKTRLAVEVAESVTNDFRHGAIFVDLAPVDDEQGVVHAFHAGLGVVQSSPGRARELVDHLTAKEALIVVDNCEHIFEPVAQLVDRILRAAASVKVLATSREPLEVYGELVHHVHGLAVDSSTTQLSEAVELFVDRIRQRRPDLDIGPPEIAIIERLCSRLDGIPLAIELAAARLRALPLAELESRLESRFSLLSQESRTAPARHSALRNTLDWSYDQLEEAERRLLARLSVFRGGFSLEAAEEVAAGIPESKLMTLTRLVDSSLVDADRVEASRYSMLETVREYLVDRRDSAGELAVASRLHSQYFCELVSRLGPLTQSEDSAVTARQLGREEANIHSALDWLLDQSSPSALQLAVDMGDYWFNAGSHEIARRYLAAAIELGGDVPLAVKTGALRHLTMLAVWDGDSKEADRLVAEQKTLLSASKDRQQFARALATQATVAWGRGQNRRARQLLIEALEAGEDHELLDQISWTARVSFHSSWMGDVETAREYLAELESMRGQSEVPILDAFIRDARGTIALQEGDLALALEDFGRARDIYQSLGYEMNVEDMLQSEAGILIDLERADEAVPLVAESLRISKAQQDRRIGARSVLLEGRIALANGFAESARDHLAAAIRMSDASDDQAGILRGLLALATLTNREGDRREALRVHALAESLRVDMDVELPLVDAARADGEREELRHELGADLADQIWESGFGLGVEDAVAVAGR